MGNGRSQENVCLQQGPSMGNGGSILREEFGSLHTAHDTESTPPKGKGLGVHLTAPVGQWLRAPSRQIRLQ